MGDFDLDKTEKPDGVPCTIYRLCKELESENKESNRKAKRWSFLIYL